MKAASLVLRLILGGVFLYAGYLKTRSPESFAGVVAAFHLLPKSMVNLFALTLPMLEMLAGLLLLTGFQLRTAAFAILLLTLLFAGALLSVPIRGLNIECGCFGAAVGSTSVTLALARDTVLAGLALFLYLRAAGRIQGDNPG